MPGDLLGCTPDSAGGGGTISHGGTDGERGDIMSIQGNANIDLTGAVWRKAGEGSGNDSVEVALLADGHVGLRNGKEPDGPVLVFTPGEWAAFTAGVHDGEFDRPK
ncbi:DUF397 domain-containing protein [Nocardia amamiensis]|nr:DUF397 domain-containing protein [Nocardia amamiensis]